MKSPRGQNVSGSAACLMDKHEWKVYFPNKTLLKNFSGISGNTRDEWVSLFPNKTLPNFSSIGGNTRDEWVSIFPTKLGRVSPTSVATHGET
ncbi:hypothetical protein CEXT_58391 [Caerostris extrusa]|uniref:Uncharacterized protein n=1 Tax=Caerostris extrusa TaxID=172846 RepID=A0AAV4XUE3_CAEEX|nr:hypothetical protein CEXT_58391 [Caerostris extrusa]